MGILFTDQALGGAARREEKVSIEVTLVRNATLVIRAWGKQFLVDPMLSHKGAMEPVQNAAGTERIPLVGLPFTHQEVVRIIEETDAILLTHLHRDHWDEAARSLIPKSKKIICQPADEAALRGQGFTNTEPIREQGVFDGLPIHRTSGRHGRGEVGRAMGAVSGFLLNTGDRKVYVAGDTIFCREVEDTLSRFNPEIIVLNAGGAEFLQGGPIIMNAQDVISVAQLAPASKIICVHLEALNHCLLSRAELKKALKDAGISNVIVPEDGATICI
ncbi:MAG TPA: MBL fold metallo-hydrolase [Sphingobacteriaceae bacterium]